jgi:hypothetical protein
MFVGISMDGSCDLIIPMPLLFFLDSDDIDGNVVIVPRDDREENDRASSHHAKASAK